MSEKTERAAKDIGLKGDEVLKCPMTFGPKVPIQTMSNDEAAAAGAAAEMTRLRKELLEAKHKAYLDYREYVGLVSQNEALRRQVEELERKLAEAGGIK